MERSAATLPAKRRAEAEGPLATRLAGAIDAVIADLHEGVHRAPDAKVVVYRAGHRRVQVYRLAGLHSRLFAFASRIMMAIYPEVVNTTTYLPRGCCFPCERVVWIQLQRPAAKVHASCPPAPSGGQGHVDVQPLPEGAPRQRSCRPLEDERTDEDVARARCVDGSARWGLQPDMREGND